MSRRTIFIVVILFLVILVLLAFTDVLIKRDRWIFPSSRGNSATISPAPDVLVTAKSAGFVPQDTTEPTVMKMVVSGDTQIRSAVLLAPEDRGAFIAWTESSNAAADFDKLKRLVHASFSSGVQDLIDERQVEAGKPNRDVLSFLDPAIHPERLLFVLSGNRIYEFHVAPGHEPQVDTLLDRLTE